MSLKPHLIFGPVFAMLALVVVVTAQTFRERVRQFKAQRLHPQQVSTRSEFTVAIKDSRCADNFGNQVETPVPFHVACIGLFVTQTVSASGLALAWAYVLLRVGHSWVNCGSNHVMTRFKLFAASPLALLALWGGALLA
jgi:hypothetical protein